MVDTIDLIVDNDEENNDSYNNEDMLSLVAESPLHSSRRANRNDNALTGRIRGLLRASAGVNPSNRWLTDCLTALREQQPMENSTDDSVLAASVLNQILLQDVRNVVRNFSNSNNFNNFDEII